METKTWLGGEPDENPPITFGIISTEEQGLVVRVMFAQPIDSFELTKGQIGEFCAALREGELMIRKLEKLAPEARPADGRGKPNGKLHQKGRIAWPQPPMPPVPPPKPKEKNDGR